MIQKAYAVGNSVVLTLPKKLGISAGTKMKYTQNGHKIIYEIVDKQYDAIDKHIKETSGGFNIGIKDTKQLMKLLKELEDNPYDQQIRVS